MAETFNYSSVQAEKVRERIKQKIWDTSEPCELPYKAGQLKDQPPEVKMAASMAYLEELMVNHPNDFPEKKINRILDCLWILGASDPRAIEERIIQYQKDNALKVDGVIWRELLEDLDKWTNGFTEPRVIKRGGPRKYPSLVDAETAALEAEAAAEAARKERLTTLQSYIDTQDLAYIGEEVIQKGPHWENLKYDAEQKAWKATGLNDDGLDDTLGIKDLYLDTDTGTYETIEDRTARINSKIPGKEEYGVEMEKILVDASGTASASGEEIKTMDPSGKHEFTYNSETGIAIDKDWAIYDPEICDWETPVVKNAREARERKDFREQLRSQMEGNEVGIQDQDGNPLEVTELNGIKVLAGTGEHSGEYFDIHSLSYETPDARSARIEAEKKAELAELQKKIDDGYDVDSRQNIEFDGISLQYDSANKAWKAREGDNKGKLLNTATGEFEKPEDRAARLEEEKKQKLEDSRETFEIGSDIAYDLDGNMLVWIIEDTIRVAKGTGKNAGKYYNFDTGGYETRRDERTARIELWEKAKTVANVERIKWILGDSDYYATVESGNYTEWNTKYSLDTDGTTLLREVDGNKEKWNDTKKAWEIAETPEEKAARLAREEVSRILSKITDSSPTYTEWEYTYSLDEDRNLIREKDGNKEKWNDTTKAWEIAETPEEKIAREDKEKRVIIYEKLLKDGTLTPADLSILGDVNDEWIQINRTTGDTQYIHRFHGGIIEYLNSDGDWGKEVDDKIVEFKFPDGKIYTGGLEDWLPKWEWTMTYSGWKTVNGQWNDTIIEQFGTFTTKPTSEWVAGFEFTDEMISSWIPKGINSIKSFIRDHVWEKDFDPSRTPGFGDDRISFKNATLNQIFAKNAWTSGWEKDTQFKAFRESIKDFYERNKDALGDTSLEKISKLWD